MSGIRILSSIAGVGFGAVCMLILRRNSRTHRARAQRNSYTKAQAFKRLFDCVDDLDIKFNKTGFRNETGINIQPIDDEDNYQIFVFAEQLGGISYHEILLSIAVSENNIEVLQHQSTARRYADKYALEPFNEIMPLTNCDPEKMDSVDRAKCMLEQLYYELTHSVDWRSLLKEFNT